MSAPDSDRSANSLPTASLVLPMVGAVLLAFTWGRTDLSGAILVVIAFVLVGCVLAAVVHAEIIARRVGEPLGSLILAVAVTVIEVGLIVTIMLGGKEGAETVARDTVLSAIMLCCNVVAGLSILIVARRDGVARFRAEGPISAIAAIATLATLSLVLPTFTSSTPGPTFSPPQLAFAAIASLTVYGLFVLVQNVRNRDLFVSVIADENDTGRHTDALPGKRRTAASALGLVVALASVVGLAKVETPAIATVVAAAGLPVAFVGLLIASIVLLPEGISAIRSARRGRIQTSLNLSYGAALASIGLTIPTVAIATIWVSVPLELGLGPGEIVLLVLTLAVSALSIVPGRATVLQGGLHLAIGAAFALVALVP